MGDSNNIQHTGAGVVIISLDNKKLLTLVKKDGTFDIPKGHAEKKEKPFETACRECMEECSISIKKKDLVRKKAYIIDDLVVFVAKTKAKPTIKKNPKTKKFEHLAALWLTPEQFTRNAPEFLSRVVEKIFLDL